MKIDLNELVSQKEAAKIRGVTIQAINILMKRGKLTVIDISGIKFLLRKEVEAYQPSVGGRPRKDSAGKASQGSKASERDRASKSTSAKKKRSG